MYEIILGNGSGNREILVKENKSYHFSGRGNG